jgi:hypothetical protein
MTGKSTAPGTGTHRRGKVQPSPSTDAEAVSAPTLPLENSVPASSTPAPVLPLFYADPVALAAGRHGDWRLTSNGAGFAAEAVALPLVVTDFAAASRSYPILFTAGEIAPVALVGLERANLFVEDGRWSDGAYVPAYVRRYPFLLIEAPDKSGFGLAVDAASGLIAREGEAGEPLFAGQEPGAVTLRALEFCRLFNQDHDRVRAFCRALAEADLLVDRQADATLPNGRKLAVSGFQVVDPARFAGLAEETVVAWHRAGWLALVHFHLASLERFTDLLARQGRRDALAGDPQASDAAPPETLPNTLPNTLQ